MKRIFAILLFLFPSALYAQTQPTTALPQIYRTFNLTSANPIGPSASPWISERGQGVKSHTIVWKTVGTVSTCSVKVQKSEDGVSWSDLIAGATCTSDSATAALTTDITNFVRINATTFSGSGTLVVTYLGYLPGAATGTISGTVDPTTPASWGLLAQASTTSGQIGPLSQCAATTAAPTYTDATTNPLNCSTGGLLRVTSSGFDNIIQIASANITVGNGATTANTPRVNIASDNTAFSVNATLGAETTKVLGTVRNKYADGTDMLNTDVAPIASATAPVMSMNSASANTGVNVAPAAACDDTSPTAITENSFGILRLNCTTHALSTQPAPLIGQGGSLVSGAVTSAMTGTTSTSVVAAPGASTYNYITQCTVSNASTTVSTDILLQDGSGGTTLYVIPAPAAAVATTGGGGAAIQFPVPLKVPTANNALFAANVTTGSSTKISCSGFKSLVSY